MEASVSIVCDDDRGTVVSHSSRLQKQVLFNHDGQPRAPTPVHTIKLSKAYAETAHKLTHLRDMLHKVLQ